MRYVFKAKGPGAVAGHAVPIPNPHGALGGRERRKRQAQAQADKDSIKLAPILAQRLEKLQLEARVPQSPGVSTETIAVNV